jgi:hypothetical protein
LGELLRWGLLQHKVCVGGEVCVCDRQGAMCDACVLGCDWLTTTPTPTRIQTTHHPPTHPPTHPQEEVEDVCDAADKQRKIERELREIAGQWQQAVFQFQVCVAMGLGVCGCVEVVGWKIVCVVYTYTTRYVHACLHAVSPNLSWLVVYVSPRNTGVEAARRGGAQGHGGRDGGAGGEPDAAAADADAAARGPLPRGGAGGWEPPSVCVWGWNLCMVSVCVLCGVCG